MKSTSVTLAIGLLLRLTSAAILLQTLFFKFTGAEESVYIFRALGAEPWGRIGSGVIELVTAVLLLVPGTAPLGGILAMGVMSGAILSHLAVLGIAVRGDGGLLFTLAVIVWLASAAIVWIYRSRLPYPRASIVTTGGQS
ncbi:MAG: DoxX family protein [Acidobacteriota bacterium]|nr:DoxX family protein [Acidobacteriota bacterium]